MRILKERNLLRVCASLAMLAILVGIGFVGHIGDPSVVAPSASPSVVAAGPTHTSHPAVPVPVSVEAAAPSTLAGKDGCPLPASQCTAYYNWGGYAVCTPLANCRACLAALSSCDSSTPGTVTDVRGSWTVPAIVGSSGTMCTDSPKTWMDVANWIGIDGFIDQTVEQTGTASDCYYGQLYYYAWYEFYPQPSYTVFAVHPGDVMSADVHYSAVTHNFTTTITDLTTHQSFTSPSTAVPGAARSSAEWVAESAYFDGFLSLTHFTGSLYTDASATIGGVTHSISGWGPNKYWMLMVDYNWGTNQECTPVGCPTPQTETLSYSKAQPSGLGSTGDSFSMKWLSNGP
jgi:hypothetical protein